MAAYSGFVTIGPDGVPIFKRLPTADEIRRFLPSDPNDMKVLYALRAELGLQTPTQLMTAQAKYLESFNITPSNPRYQQQLANLSKTVNSNKVLVATARRTTEATQTFTAIGGDYNHLVIRVAEGEAPCEPCEELNGETGTYSYFVKNDLTPGTQCYGGLNCLCTLVPYE